MVLRIGVIGQSGPISEELRAAAFAVGRAVGARGALLFTGGRDGVMAAASQGAQSAGGVTVGILPGDDLREGKQTVLIARAVELLAPDEAAALDADLGDPDLGADRVAHWQAVLEACGARRAVEERVAALSHEAAGAVAGLLAHGVPDDVSAELTQLIDAYTSRRH